MGEWKKEIYQMGRDELVAARQNNRAFQIPPYFKQIYKEFSASSEKVKV